MAYSRALINIGRQNNDEVRAAFNDAAALNPGLVPTLPDQYEIEITANENDTAFRNRVESIAGNLVNEVVERGVLWRGGGDIRTLQPLDLQVSFIPDFR